MRIKCKKQVLLSGINTVSKAVANKTVKPIITWLTLPITALSLGLFYPFINVLLLKLISLILGSYFTVKGIFLLALISIFISVMNILMDRLFIKPLLKEGV